MPGSGFLEAASAASSTAILNYNDGGIGVRDVTIPAPLVLKHSADLSLQASIDCLTGQIEIASMASGPSQIHCRGNLCAPLSGTVPQVMSGMYCAHIVNFSLPDVAAVFEKYCQCA